MIEMRQQLLDYLCLLFVEVFQVIFAEEKRNEKFTKKLLQTENNLLFGRSFLNLKTENCF